MQPCRFSEGLDVVNENKANADIFDSCRVNWSDHTTARGAEFLPADLSVAGAGTSSLEELEDKLDAATAQREEAEKRLDSAKEDYADALEEKSLLDGKILALNVEIYAQQQLIAGYETSISMLEDSIDSVEQQLEEQFEVLRMRIRVNHEDGGMNLLEILFDSEGLTDFFMRMDRYVRILEYDKQLFDNYSAEVETYTRQRDELQNLVNLLNSQLSELEARQSELTDELASADRLVATTESDLATAQQDYEKAYAAEQQYNSDREAKLAELQKTSNKSYVGGTLLWPLPTGNNKVSCGFGWRIHPVTGRQQFHNGIDIPAPYGTEIYAVNDGTVIEVSYNYGDGYYVTISHGGGIASFYSHVSRYLVSVGDTVTRGQVIAYVGTSGYVTGAHLNLNIYENGKAVNPLNYFNAG